MTHPGDAAHPPNPEPTPDAATADAEIVDVPPSGPVAPSYEEVTGYTTSGVPTFDHVREKIERRTTTALGAEELAHGTTAGQDAERAFAEREKAAKAKLEEIRRSLGSPATPPDAPGA
ncbi:PspA/IM30 family protein [Tsukamurella ocularis]|uniref:PspA/IM30 family protein n=1 Tax=Tsukamurella ocularis TaxID=1970234 RepID=UPI0039EE64F5